MRPHNPDHAYLAAAMGPIAREVMGDPNARLSSKDELRFGTNGSLSVDLRKGVWFDNEAKVGGGVLDFLRVKLGIVNGVALEHLRERSLLPDDAPPKAKARVVASYDYRDAAGELLFQVLRYEPKTFRQRRPDGKGGWLWNLNGVGRVPYGLRELLDAIGVGETIYIAEGEKDVDNLRRLGLAATCNSGGAGKWTPEHNEWLNGAADIVILQDADEPGRKHAAAVAEQLKDGSRRIRILEIPGAKDVSEWIEQGGGAEHLEALVEQHAREPAGDPAPEAALPLLWFDEIEPVLDAKDFVQGVLTEGGAAVVYGESNGGKTFWTTDLALHVAAGKEWNGRRVDQGGVVYCVLEGGHGFRNRVSAWRRAHAPEGGLPFAAIPSAINLLDPDADTERLINTIKAAQARIGRPVKLVVIDTLSRALAGGNENAPDDMGALVMNMDRVRAETGACVLFVHHSGKDAAKGARGHSSLRAAIDSEFEVVADADTDARSATVVKQRDMPKGAVFGFRLEQITLGFNQHGEPVTTCTVQSQMASPKVKGAHLTPEDAGVLKDLRDFFDDPRQQHELTRPDPDMPQVQAAKRAAIRQWLLKRGRLDGASAPLHRSEPGCNGATPDGVSPEPRCTPVAPSAGLSPTERSRFNRFLNRLKDRGKLAMLGDWLWLL